MALAVYMRIRQYVIDLIREHAESAVPIMSERELCEKFAVTRPTARRALKELIDEGYLLPKPGLGTFINPARDYSPMAALRKSFTVMVVFGSGRHTDLDGFCMDVLARVCDRLKHLPVRLRMANLNQADRSMALEELRSYNPDGVLWVRPDEASVALISTVRESVPVYAVGNVADGGKFQVTMDYHQCGRLAAAWFLDRGRKRALFVGNVASSSVIAAVHAGWRDEFACRGANFLDTAAFQLNPDFTDRFKDVLAGKTVDGIFTFGYVFAAVDAVLAELGVTPEECPVVADENYFGYYGATTVPAAKLIMFPPELAELAADNLFKTLNAPGFAPEEVVLNPRIEDVKP